LLVFGAWGADWLFYPQRLRRLRPLLTASATAFAVFLPWQIYIHIRFPKEAAYEQAYNTRHIFEVIEGHYGGGWDYYFSYFHLQYGDHTWLLLFIGVLATLLLGKKEHNRLRNALLLAIAAVYIFFSFVAKTKIPSYVYVVAPLVYLFMGVGIDQVFGSSANSLNRKIASLALLLLGCYLSFSFPLIDAEHLSLNPDQARYHERKINNTNVFRRLDAETPAGSVVCNCNDDLEALFFCNRDCYPFTPTPEKFDEFVQKKTPIFVLSIPELGVPAYMQERPNDFVQLKEKILR
jgi:hypothetical protein